MAKFSMHSVRFYYDRYDPGTAATRLSVTLAAASLDPTSVTDVAEQKSAGVRQDQVAFAGWFDDGSEAMKTLVGTGAKVVSMYVGTGTGSKAYCGQAHLVDAPEPVARAELVRQEATFVVDGQLERAHVLRNKFVATATGNSGSADNGTISGLGGTLYVHIHSLSGTGTGTITLQDAAVAGTWAAVANMTFNPTGAGATAIGTTGTLRRFRRLIHQTGATATTFTFSAALSPAAPGG